MSRYLGHGAALGLAVAISAALPALAQETGATEPAREAALQDLTPENTVFIYVDFNTGLDNHLTTVPGPVFRENVQAFAKLGEVFDPPIALLGDEDETYYGPFYPEIEPLRAVGQRFPRTTPSGYTPELAAWLEETGRTNVVIGGISIDNCVLHTTLDLIRAGYNVYVLTDVSPTNNPFAQAAAETRMTQAGAVPMTWITLATDLVGDWNSPYGQELMPVMGQHLAPSTVGERNDTTPDGLGL
jgi:nicotinamidase-related amidase